MNRQDTEQIKKWAGAAGAEIHLKLLKTEDPRSEEIENFCRDLTERAPGVSFRRLTDHTSPLPAIEVTQGLRFSEVPGGRELAPFLEALSYAAGQGDGPREELKKKIRALDGPAFLDLYVTSQCPFCPEVLSGLIPLVFENGSVRLRVIDGMLFNEAAAEAEVRSAPTLILNGGFRFSGSIDLSEVLTLMVEGDAAQMGAATLESLLKEGDAGRIARLMLDRGKIFPAFPELIAHDRWSVRLGAMVVMEQIAAEDSGLAAEAVGPLLEMFDRKDRSVQGDMVYIIGEIAGPETLPWLESLDISDSDPDFKTVVEEAVDRIGERNKRGWGI